MGDFPFTRDTCGTLVLISHKGNNFPKIHTFHRRVGLTNYKVVIHATGPAAHDMAAGDVH